MRKKIIGLSLATTLLLSTVACAAEIEKVDQNNKGVEVVSQDSNTAEKSDIESKYINYQGKVSEVIREDGITYVIVDSIDKSSIHKTIKFNVSDETLVLSEKTQDFVKSEKIVEGMNVDAFYAKDAPMTKSIPPMTSAKAIVLRDSDQENKLGVKVDKFNEELISEDNFLKLNITEDTVIVDRSGNKLTKEDVANKEIVVFYGPAVTMSIPAQSNAVKIIVLSDSQKPETPEVNKDIVNLDKVELNGKQVTLQARLYKSGETFMMPIREIGKNLGYEVSWNNDQRQAELKKDANFLTAHADKDIYSFAKMIVKLGKATEIKDGTMYVPVSFIEEVMKLDMSVTEDGTLIVK